MDATTPRSKTIATLRRLSVLYTQTHFTVLNQIIPTNVEIKTIDWIQVND